MQTSVSFRPQGAPSSVAVLEWARDDGIAAMISHELAALRYTPISFVCGSPIPKEAEILFSYGPYDRLLPVLQHARSSRTGPRPVTVHWNTEGFPDLRIPPALRDVLGDVRSWVGRVANPDQPSSHARLARRVLALCDQRALRFRYIGDYKYAHRRGLIDVLADCSQLYVGLHRQRGVPATYLPWGASPPWYADLGCKRDIDVLWLGKRGSSRRSRLLDRIRLELRAHGIEMYVADGEENPFVYGDDRTQFLNRAKIVLNLTRTWYDDNYLRFALAAPNRAMIVSEPMLPHCPAYEAGRHYISSPIDRLAETIVHYLRHEDERQVIVENAYRLVTTTLLFRNSLKAIMDAVSDREGQRV